MTAVHWRERLQSWTVSQAAWGVLSAALILGSWTLWMFWSRVMLAVQLLVLGSGAALLYSFPILGTMLTAFLLVSGLSFHMPGLFTPMLAAFLAVIMFRKLLSGDVTLRILPITVWLLLLVSLYYISLLWTDSMRYFTFTRYIRTVLLVLVFTETIRTRKDFIAVLVAMAVGTIVAGVETARGAAEFYLGGAASALAGNMQYLDQSRFFGLWAGPNMMAMTQVPVIAFSYALFRSHVSIWIRALSAVAILAGIMTVLMSLSRGGAVCLMIALIVIMAVDRYRVHIFAVSAILIGGFLSVFPSNVLSRLSTLAADSSGSNNQRWELIVTGWRMFIDNFPLGVGPQNFRLYSSDYAVSLEFGMIAHNAYIQVLAETGVIGILLFAAILGSLVRSVRWRGVTIQSGNLSANMNTAALATVLSMLLALATITGEFFLPFWISMIIVAIRPIVFSESESGVESRACT